MNIAVVGMGYVGCVTAACLSKDGHRLIGVDIDQGKVDSINNGVTPIFEPGLAELLRNEVEAERLSATTELKEAVAVSEVILVAVGTPSSDDGSIDSTAVERVMEKIGSLSKTTEHDLTVVIRSTLLPGVLEDVIVPRLNEVTGGQVGSKIRICNNPEFLRETTAIADYDEPPFVLVGADDQESANTALSLYANLKCEKIVSSTRVAAMIKYTCNAFHALKVGFANEIGTLAKSFGADGKEVMEIVCKDTQLNISSAYLKPGFAFGGSCLPKDVRALARYAQQKGIALNMMQSILPSNMSHLDRAVRMIKAAGHRKIGLAGLSFKAGTDDLRESPQVILAESLIGQGYDLKIFDPDVRVTALVGSNRYYIDEKLPHLARLLCDTSEELLEHSQLLIVATKIIDRVEGIDAYNGPVIDLRSDLVVDSQEERLTSTY